MEIANTSDLFLNPLHPYTQGLFNAIPRLTGEGIGEGIDGQIPNYFIPPKGCRFQPRCRYSMDICRIEKPPLYKVSPSHSVACFLFQKARINERAASYE
jgi:peptide/nickel transport system ATP-binding protein